MYIYTSSPPQEKLFIWPPFHPYNYNRRLFLREKTGGACLYMPQDGYWLATVLKSYTPPQKRVGSSAAKK